MEGMDWLDRGLQYFASGKYNKAIGCFQNSLSIYKENGDQEMIALCHCSLGNCYKILDNYSEAIIYFEQSLSIHQEKDYQEMIAHCYFCLAKCYVQIHDYDKATNYAKKGAEITKETGDLKTEGNAYVYIGDALRQKGELRESMKYYMKWLEIATQTRDKQLEASAYNNLGVISMELGERHDAIRYFETNINSELGSENNGFLYNNLGCLYMRVGQHHKAAEFLKLSLDIVKETGKFNEIAAYQNLSVVYYQTNESVNLAREYRWISIILAIRTGHKSGEVRYFNDLGECFCKTDKITEAITSHKKTLDLAFKTKFYKYIGDSYVSLGDTYFQFGMHMVDEAIRVSEKGLKIFTDSGDKEREARGCCEMGMLYLGLAQYKNICNDHVEYARNINTSEQYLRKSLQCYEELFDDLREKHEFKISIVDTYIEAYNTLALLLINTNRTTEALIVCERGRACVLGDTLACKYGMHQQQVFVENMSTRKPLDESDLADLLPKESSLLFYSTIDDSEHFWVLSQQQSLIYTQNDMQQKSITTKNITDYIYQLADSAYQFMHFKQMAANCEDRSLAEQESLKELLKELFRQLITPVKEHLTQDEVIIIPDGPLNMVPFAALQDPQTGRFFCETKRIRLAPSLTTLKILKECPDDCHSKEGALVIGNPIVGKVMVGGKKENVVRKSGAERNAVAVSNILSDILNVSTLIGRAATKDAVKEKLQEDAAVIHIVAHADVTTGKIFLATANSAQSEAIPDEKDCTLTMQEVQENRVRAKLVVLNCCSTGRGEIRAEGVLCMARAFLVAGARAVVASSYYIHATASFKFMQHFYIQLKLGKSASVSLNESMKKMIHDKEYNEPKFWAPFFLIGDDVTIFDKKQGT